MPSENKIAAVGMTVVNAHDLVSMEIAGVPTSTELM